MAAWAKGAEGLLQGPLKALFVRQMLEKVAGKNKGQRIFRQWPRLATILAQGNDPFVSMDSGIGI